MWICKIFGHKIRTTILNTNYKAQKTITRTLDEPICRRCGLSLKQLQNKK